MRRYGWKDSGRLDVIFVVGDDEVGDAEGDEEDAGEAFALVWEEEM